MASEIPFTAAPHWPVVLLSDITRKIGSGATPTGGAESYLERREQFALVRSQNVFDRRFDESGLAFISDAQARGLKNAALQENDVLLNITGDGVTFGRACRVPASVLPACVNQHVSIIRVDPAQADAGFVLSYLTHPLVKRYIESFNAGGSRRAVTKGHIKSFALPLPPLPEQKRIAHILGTLDDKIDLNRRMNATLEGISRAIFKSWFVDFDPVRQKAAGQQPFGMDAQTAALFPDSFEDSEIGEVPKGWRVAEVRDCLSLTRESVDPAECPAETFDHYSIPAFDAGCWPSPDLGDAIKSQKRLVSPGCVLISKLNPRTPRVWIPQAISERRGIASTEFLVAIPAKTKGIGIAFLFCFALSDSFVDYLASHASGTSNSHQRVRPEDFLSCQIALPPVDVLLAFDLVAEPLLRQSSHARSESKSLAALRDALLPKLLSGEIRVPEAEQAVEEAVR